MILTWWWLPSWILPPYITLCSLWILCLSMAALGCLGYSCQWDPQGLGEGLPSWSPLRWGIYFASGREASTFIKNNTARNRLNFTNICKMAFESICIIYTSTISKSSQLLFSFPNLSITICLNISHGNWMN